MTEVGTSPLIKDGNLYMSSSGVSLPNDLDELKANEPAGRPKAYLNWLVYNKDWEPIMSKSSYARVSTAAMDPGQIVSGQLVHKDHQRLFIPEAIQIEEPGFVYIWLSNETDDEPFEVFFDEFTVEHIKSPVVQTDDYYPFGLTFNSYQRESSVQNQYKFNGIERQDELDLGWDLAQFRAYNPTIGRFLQIDPVLKEHESPYAWNTNNPLLYADPTGADSLQRAQAVAKAKEFESKNPGNQYPTSEESAKGEIRGAPGGGKVDCSGMVAQCIIASGMEDPVVKGHTKGDNGVKAIVNVSEKVGDKDDMSKVEVGNAITINNGTTPLDSKKDFSHIGIVSKIEFNDDGSVKTLQMIDSGGKPSTNKSGPRTTNIISDGVSNSWWGPRVTGFYKWDSKESTTASK